MAGERLLQSVGHGGGGGDGLKEALRGVQASMQALHSKFKI